MKYLGTLILTFLTSIVAILALSLKVKLKATPV